MVSTQRHKQAVSNLTGGVGCCLGRLLPGPKASEEKVKQHQCPKASLTNLKTHSKTLFTNLKPHSKTGFPQPGETHKLSAEKHENEFLP